MKLKKMTDEKCLETFIKLLEERVSITTGFADADDGIFTHEFLTIRCGDQTAVSSPQPLDVPLRIANAAEMKEVLN